MARQVAVPSGIWHNVTQALFPESGEEGFVFGLARICPRKDGAAYLVESLVPLGECEIQYSHAAGVVVTQEGSGRLNKIAADVGKLGYIPVHIHSHPSSITDFSPVDDEYERRLSRWLADRDQPFLVSILAPREGTAVSRVWHKGEALRSETRIGLAITGTASISLLPALDRQRAFGPLLRTGAKGLRVGIVGLGGVGLPVAEQLARCGFSSFVLIDPDRVEETNLNRLQGLTRKSIGRRKVDVVSGIIQRAGHAVGTTPKVAARCEDIYLAGEGTRQALRECDLVLALTDDHLSRLVCLELAFQGGADYLQAGVDVRLGENGAVSGLLVETVGAEIGRYCPLCLGRLDPGEASLEARRYVGGEVWRKALKDGYVPEVASPAVMSLNAVSAGILVTEIQRRVSGMGTTDLIQFDLHTGSTLYESQIERLLEGGCSVCGN